MKKSNILVPLLAAFLIACLAQAADAQAVKKTAAGRKKAAAQAEKNAAPEAKAAVKAEERKTARAGIEKTWGVPKSAACVVQLSMAGKFRGALCERVDSFAASAEYFKSTTELFRTLGSPVPPGAARHLKKITQASVVLFAKPDARTSPEMALIVCADDGTSAAEIMAGLKNKLSQFARDVNSAEIEFSETAAGEAKIIAVGPKDKKLFEKASNEVSVVSLKNSVALVYQKKGAGRAAEVAAALGSEKETFASTEAFKKASAGSGENAFAFLYFGPEFIASADTTAADLISSIFVGFESAADLSKVSVNGRIALAGKDGGRAAAGVNAARVVFGGIKKNSDAAGYLPSATLAMAEIRMKLGAELFSLPGMEVLKSLPMIDLEKEFFSWADGEIFAAVETMEDPKEFMMKGTLPDFYIGIGSKDDAGAGAFLEKAAQYVKAVSPDVEVADSRAAGTKIKVFTMPSIPMKSIEPAAGPSGKFLLIASNAAAFEKIAAKKGGKLSDTEGFKAVLTERAGTCFSLFVNGAAIRKAFAAIAPIPEKERAEALNQVSACAGFDGSEAFFTVRAALDPAKITPELIGSAVSGLFGKAAVKK